MSAKIAGWLTAQEAATEYGIAYNTLRNLVIKGVFTRGNFGASVVRPPIYLRVEELDAWRRGGVNAAKAAKAAYEASCESAPSPAGV